LENKGSLEFVASLTTDASCIRRLSAAIGSRHQNPFARVLISPLFARPSAIEAVRRLRAQHGSVVYFDSGGYSVQQGRIRYDELVSRLLEVYKAHPWADHYVLPDYVPRSTDSARTVSRKVKATIEGAKSFVRLLPTHLQQKVMPVVHGRSSKDVDRCLEAYSSFGSRVVGFGSLSTGGSGGGSNLVTNSSGRLLQYLADRLRGVPTKLHLFGVGAPGVIGLLPGLGVCSFDSASWMKAAGFGQIFFPFSRSFSLRCVPGQPFRKRLTGRKLRTMKRLTRHGCTFCDSIQDLRADRLGRMVHNLLTIVDAVEMTVHLGETAINRMYERVSPYYRERYRKLNNRRE